MKRPTKTGAASARAAVAEAARAPARGYARHRCTHPGAGAPRGAVLGALATLLIATAGDALAQADAKRGEKLYEECRACHALEPGVHGVGPSLAGVIGRKAAALDAFRFSPALRRSNLTWTAQALDAFVADRRRQCRRTGCPTPACPTQRTAPT